MAIGRIGGVSGGDTILETYRYTATAGQTSVSGADASGKTLVYPANYEAVFLNGVRLARGLDYTATTGNSITGLAARAAGDIIEIAVLQSLDVVQVDYADVRFAAEEPSNPVNGTVWIDSDATVNVADYALTNSPTFTGTVNAPQIFSVTETSQTVLRPDFYADSANARLIQFRKARGSIATPAVVQDGDTLGAFEFLGYSALAPGFRDAARITAQVDGSPDTGTDATDMPGRLIFSTTPDGSSGPVERMRITNSGRIQLPVGGILEAPISTNAQTTNYTLVLTDAGRLIEMGSASALTLTIPADASVNFPVGTKIDVLRTGTGEVTIAGATSPNTVTVNSEGSKLRINAQWQAISLIKRATNTWVAIGALKT